MHTRHAVPARWATHTSWRRRCSSVPWTLDLHMLRASAAPLFLALRSGKRVAVAPLNFTLSSEEVAAAASEIMASTDRYVQCAVASSASTSTTIASTARLPHTAGSGVFVSGGVQCCLCLACACSVLDAVGAATLPSPSPLESIVKPLAEIETRLEPLASSVSFLKDVSTSKDIRDASVAANQKLSEHGVKSRMRMVRTP